jgi:DNA-binding IclR family transcriptional regulator
MSKIVERTLDLLELFAEEKRPLSLSDIARLLKIPVSSCHDVLQAMQGRGYLYELAPRAGYYPTLRLQELGRVIGDHDPVVLRADAMLRPIRDTLDESVLLAKASGLQAHYLLVLEPAHSLQYRAKVGDMVRNTFLTSGGRAILGSLTAADLDQALEAAEIRPMTARTVTDKAVLRADIEHGRARGWYLNQGETQEGVTTLSAPFRWGAAVYIITVAGPSPRLEPKLEQAAALIVDAAKMLGPAGR